MFACDPNQEIQLGAAMGCPEVGIAGSQRSNDLLQRGTTAEIHRAAKVDHFSTLTSLEEIGPPLDFVNDCQAGEFFQRPHGRRQSANIDGVLQIEIGARPALGDQSGERSFAALARTQKSCDRVSAEGMGDTFQCARSWNHHRKFTISLKIIM
jgi:hypothetical protein